MHPSCMSLSLAIFASLTCLAAPSQAWFDMGHMEVAAIAWNTMNPAAQAEASRLLRLNPSYGKWVAKIPGERQAKQDQLVFVRAATWADDIKDDDTYQDRANQPSAAGVTRNDGYDRMMHRYWHYYDQSFSVDETPRTAAEAPNARTQILAFRMMLKVLAETPKGLDAVDQIKSFDLSWLLHLVGDVHQPLHAITRVTHAEPEGDGGGNGVTVTCGAECTTLRNLHLFWDGHIGAKAEPWDAIAAAETLARADPARAAILDEEVWFKESFDIAREHVYAGPIGIGTGPFALDQDYMNMVARISHERIALAGARLGNLLNELLK